MTTSLGIELAERGVVPTPLLRQAMRKMCRDRLDEIGPRVDLDAFVRLMAAGPIAPVPKAANDQHYEVPAEFFRLVLGPHLKYSSALWPDGAATLEAAERKMLELTCERAGIEDGQEILELGCGWGSLSLHMARAYPHARICGMSNSAVQRRFIEERAPANLAIVTADMNGFDPGRRFDRIVSVEMFEHMRNWPMLLERVAGWLKDDGQVFIHVFCHRRGAYPFETEGADNWMGRNFFTGGIMPAFDLLPAIAGPLQVREQWWVDGTHYQRTAAAWRRKLELQRRDVVAVLRERYGGEAARWHQRWRMFFLACEELFGYAGGSEWGVAHYRLSKGD